MEIVVPEQELKDRYELFNQGDLDSVVDHFHDDAEIRQLESGQTVRGRAQIRGLMEGWRHFFAGARVTNVRVQPADDRLSEVPGAVQCARATFTGVGRYVNTMPGLEDQAPARGQQAEVPFTEIVWLDKDGQFIRVDNSMDVSALQ